ncbi:class I SAM-dependent methyltransferase [Methanosphaerula palustris]|uniref:Methyltransferase type 11 n=1 Tax=Methanosphaerula palustris (strain ATCC BAA-1556 / DSM 19958 / E1-9c) TaxID=521011 RepID=B8GI62_METPE|nr:methyltransferase domain-containing protein [Methanosphaerula palustris]ACL15413.1 Methyltransferase type 11 [Methanosphaerula palustris E1-9c]
MKEKKADHEHDPKERVIWQDPDRILGSIGVREGATFIDVGCGDGFFALPAAVLVGLTGMVYGIDVDEGRLARLSAQAREQGLENIRLVRGEAEESVPCQGCADIVFFGTCLHDFADPATVLQNARLMLKPGGILVDLDWKKEEMPLGPPFRIRFSEEEAASLIAGAGFQVRDVVPSGPYCYLLTAALPSDD